MLLHFDGSLAYLLTLIALVSSELNFEQTVRSPGSALGFNCVFGPAGKKERRSDCGEWQWSVCVANEGDCGLGTREGTRTGNDCKQTIKTQRCKIPCNWKKKFGGTVREPRSHSDIQSVHNEARICSRAAVSLFNPTCPLCVAVKQWPHSHNRNDKAS